jgi:glycine/D-amino acid oxidase-like deaminating enzyme
MAFPDRATYLIIGAGVHGLSTAWHLGLALRARGRTLAADGPAPDILVLDKTAIAAGASGIACGVVRNNYTQSAMRQLMAHSVSVWESDPRAFSYHPVGYMQISPDCMGEDMAAVAAEQRAIGYDSTFVDGAADSAAYMTGLFDDWPAEGITSVLHERRGGYANNTAAVYGLATKAEAAGARILTGVTVTGLRIDGDAVTAVETDRGRVAVDHLVVAVGPWVKTMWDLLELPRTVTVKGLDGSIRDDVPMWTYWSLQEGTLGVDPGLQRTNDGAQPPVIHVDTDAPLHSDVDGSLITDRLWGLYYKPDLNFGGIQGGAMPFPVAAAADDVAVDPYGPESPDFVVGDDFSHLWCSGLAFCQERFSGRIGHYKKEPSGGIGCFTPDSFPVFDTFRHNAYVIADSNHGFKMIGVGALVADELLGARQALLEPFRFSRYAEGRPLPVSNSPFPWS